MITLREMDSGHFKRGWLSKWSTLSHMYKLQAIKLFYKVFGDDAPHALSY